MRPFFTISIFFLSVFLCKHIDGQEQKTVSELIALQANNPTEKVDLLNHLTDSLIKSDPDQCIEYAETAIRIAMEHNYYLGEIRSLNHLADIYWGKTDLLKANQFATEAKKIAAEQKYNKGYAEAIYILAKIHNDLGDYNKSSELSFEALKLVEQENDKHGECKILNTIGYIYYEQGEFDKALKYYSKSLEVARAISDSVGIAKGLNNVGAVYANKNEFSTFVKNIKEAVEINKKQGQRFNEGINYSNLGESYLMTSSYDSALYYFNKAETIFLELNSIPKLSFLYLSYYSYYKEIGDAQKSKENAIKAYQLSVDNRIKRSIYQSAQILHELYISESDLENAYKYSLIEHQYKDSLDHEQSLTKLSQLELNYEFEKQKQEDILKQQQKEFLIIINAGIVIFLFILIIIILLARHRIKIKNDLILQKQLEVEIDTKNKELASNVMTLMRKNEVLSEIADNLMDVRDDAVKDETKIAIKRIARKLNKTTDNEIWEEFEIRFKQVHSEFYDHLLKKFPSLTPNEERLCAFLRLNMTSKEISELTGQRIATLEIARSRLRKKLGIANTDTNLVIFLSQI